MTEPLTNSIAVAERKAGRRRLPNELGIVLVLIGIALFFEAVGWGVRGCWCWWGGDKGIKGRARKRTRHALLGH